MNWLYAIFLVLCKIQLIYNDLSKCCKQNHYLEKYHDTFKCSDLPANTSYILTSTTNFIENNTDGECVEFSENFYVFNINNSKVSQQQIIEENIYSKCCPLNFVYDTDNRACMAEISNQSDIKENYIKVGLPRCTVILDEIINSISEDYYKLENHSSCVDRTKNGSFVLRQCNESKEVCSQMTCVRKCCPDGQSYVNTDKELRCTEGYEGIHFTFRTNVTAKDSFAIVIANDYPYQIIFDATNNTTVLDQTENSLYNYFTSENVVFSTNYCIEYIQSPDNGYFFLVNADVDEDSYNNIFISYFLLISSVLLALTIVIYFLLGETKKLCGKILVNYNLAMLFWYVPFVSGGSVRACTASHSIELFASFATYTWSNVMCWDLYNTLRSTNRQNTILRNNQNYKKFIIYCFYGWGVALVLFSTILLLDKYNSIFPEEIKLQLCFYDKVPRGYGKLLFLWLPSQLFQIVNLVLLIKTIVYWYNVKHKINAINCNINQNENLTTKLCIILKLFLIMGVTFMLSLITSPFMQNSILMYLNDIFITVISAHGIIIFVIFVCNKQIYNSFKKKLKDSVTSYDIVVT